MATGRNVIKLCGALFLGILVMLLSSCGGGGGKSSGSSSTAFDYGGANLTFAVGDAIERVVPNTSGIPIVAFSVSPALPKGLDFSGASGAISGIATDSSPTTQYTVTAKNEAGKEIKTGLTLTVTPTEISPFYLFYECFNCSFPVGKPILPLEAITAGGQIESCSTVGSLPAGLTVNPTTCEIAGTPLATGSTTITVVGSNTAGQVTTDITFKVEASAAATTNLDYGENLIHLTVGLPMQPLIPTYEGGQCGTRVIEGVFPEGITMGEGGVISGVLSQEISRIEIYITCHPVDSSNISFLSALSSMLMPSAFAQTVPASTTITLVSGLKRGFFGTDGTGKEVDYGKSDYYYYGNTVWSKPDGTLRTYAEAKSFCVGKKPILDGKRWDLPGFTQMAAFTGEPSPVEYDKGVSLGWPLDQPGLWVEPGWIPNFSFVTLTQESIKLNKPVVVDGVSTPLTENTKINSTCFLRV